MQYIRQDVFQRNLDGITLYICLQRATDGYFAVHQSETIPTGALRSSWPETQMTFFELFSEIEPSERCDWFKNIFQAIEAHINDFS
jgi:hypothetical protein